MIDTKYRPNLSEKLEKELKGKGTLERFLSDYEAICTRSENIGMNRKYAECVHQLLELSHAFNSKNVDYIMIGGLSVLAHLQSKDPSVLSRWRGTEDVDLLMDAEKAKGTLGEFGYRSEKPLHNVRDGDGVEGKLYNFVRPNDSIGTSIGLREGVKIGKARITNEIYRDSNAIDFYGIPVNVPSLKHLKSMKKAANRKKDREDISSLKALR